MVAKKKVEKQTEVKNKTEPEVSYEFDVNKFASTKFIAREADVNVPAMVDFYPKGIKPVVRVRGLYGDELAKVDEQVQINAEARRELNKDEKIPGEVVEALQVILRTYDKNNVPDNHVKMMHYVQIGLVKPEMEYTQVIKLAKRFPIEFRIIFYKISALTGRGMEPGK